MTSQSKCFLKNGIVFGHALPGAEAPVNPGYGGLREKDYADSIREIRGLKDVLQGKLQNPRII